MASLGPSADTQAGDIVCINVPPDGPYGVSFVPDSDGCAAVVQSFEKLPSGRFGPVQRDGGVHVGDILCEINDVSLMNRRFDEAIKMIADRNTLRKEFKFMNPRDYYRKKRGVSLRAAPADSKNSFLSTVKRTRLIEIDGKKVAEYEIACQMRLASEKVHKEIVYQWSVWKRFSLFEQLHRELRRSLGWRMDGIDLPSPHHLTLNKLSPEFIATRRDDLKEYWNRLVSIEKVTDFQKHHCSVELKAFLEVDLNMRDKEVAAAADMLDEKDSVSVSGESRAGGKRMTRVNSRRLSTRQLSSPRPVALTPSASSNNNSSVFQFEDGPRAVKGSGRDSPESVRSSSPPPSSSQALVISSGSSVSGGSLPPKALGDRANLLSSINALRID